MRQTEAPSDEVVMQWAGRLLARRAHAENELRTKLARRGAPEGVVEDVIARLRAVGLVDDAAFAEEWAGERRRRGRGPEWVTAELEAKGVARETAEAAARIDDEDEAAIAAAARLIRRVAHRPLAEQGRRLLEMLGRRGFSEEAAVRAAQAVLPPEGWD